MKRILPVLFILSMLLNVCNVADEDPFDRKLLMSQLTEKVILPRHQQLQDTANAFYQSVQNFHAQPTLTNFQQVRSKWLSAKQAYKHTSVFNFGQIAESVVHNKMNKWPCNTDFIDGFLADTVTLDQVYVDSKGSTSKGLAAMEYLLFDPARAESDMLNDFTMATDAQRRLDLLLAYAEDLYFKAYFLNDLWLPSGDDYANFLATTEPTNGIGSPVEMLLNEMIAQTERIVHTELGAPLGAEGSGVANVELAEAFRSQRSLQCVREGVASLRETFVGNVENGAGSSSASLENHLIYNDAAEAAQNIKNGLDNTLQLIDAFNGTLEDGITSQPQQLEAIRTELQTVLGLLKVDAIYALSATLTFNENDGD
ncbi:MAG: hypothetical protein GC178_07465 [Flavobacteriales bacterium]|nr:hypothetical protein [Flavobacteriales bacterium]